MACTVFNTLQVFVNNHLLLQFEEARDAEDAIRGRDGYDFDGHRLRVCFALCICNLYYAKYVPIPDVMLKIHLF